MWSILCASVILYDNSYIKTQTGHGVQQGDMLDIKPVMMKRESLICWLYVCHDIAFFYWWHKCIQWTAYIRMNVVLQGRIKLNEPVTWASDPGLTIKKLLIFYILFCLKKKIDPVLILEIWQHNVIDSNIYLQFYRKFVLTQKSKLAVQLACISDTMMGQVGYSIRLSYLQSPKIVIQAEFVHEY